MKQIALALIWESWMLTWRGFLGRLMSACVFLVFIILALDDGTPISDDDLRGIRIVTFYVAVLCMLSGLSMYRTQADRVGFAFPLGYTRPAPTWLLVLIPLAFRCTLCVLLYLLPLSITHLLYGMPTQNMQAWLVIVPISLMSVANTWWSDRKGISQLAGWIVVIVTSGMLVYYALQYNEHILAEDINLTWTFSFSYYPRDLVMMLLISLIAIVMTVLGVQRQRHSDPPLFASTTANQNENWFAELYETECPRRGALRAELWQEINGQGMPAILWSAIAAVCTPLIFLLLGYTESDAIFWMVAGLIMLVPFLKGTPSFGIRIKEGVPDVSIFAVTRPLPTASLAAIKLGTAVVSILIGLSVLATSFWFSAVLVEDHIFSALTMRNAIEDWVSGTPTWEILVQLMIYLVQFISIVCFVCISLALSAAFGERFNLFVLILLIYSGVVPVLIAAKFLPVLVGEAHLWACIVLVALAAVTGLASAITRRLLSLSQVSVLLSVAAAYAYGFLSLAVLDGNIDETTPALFLGLYAGVCFATPAVLVWAPLSLSMARHR